MLCLNSYFSQKNNFAELIVTNISKKQTKDYAQQRSKINIGR